MAKENIKKETVKYKKDSYIDLIYDEDRFKFHIVDDAIVLYDIKKDKIIKIFNNLNQTGFIAQSDIGEDTYFVRSYYEEEKTNNINGYKKYLEDYKYGKNSDFLNFRTQMESFTINYDECTLGDASYVVGKGANAIYSVSQNGKTRNISIIKRGFKPETPVEGNIVFVIDGIKTCYKFGVPQVSDTLIYGLDPDTLKIRTDIYSEAQDRVIPIYKDEQVEEYINKYPGHRPFYYYDFYDYVNSNDTNGCTTIDGEILSFLEEKTKEFYKTYGYDWNDKAFESFVKKIGVYPKENKND